MDECLDEFKTYELILVDTAGRSHKSEEQMEELDKQIATWQSKMSDKVDYYTNKFTQLEMLINQMNSQSSALAGLTGGSY